MRASGTSAAPFGRVVRRVGGDVASVDAGQSGVRNRSARLGTRRSRPPWAAAKVRCRWAPLESASSWTCSSSLAQPNAWACGRHLAISRVEHSPAPTRAARLRARSAARPCRLVRPGNGSRREPRRSERVAAGHPRVRSRKRLDQRDERGHVRDRRLGCP